MKLRDTVADLADSLELPEEAVSDAMRVTLIGRAARRGGASPRTARIRRAERRGERRRRRVRILGAELTLHAMDRDTLIVTGRIAAVEYA